MITTIKMHYGACAHQHAIERRPIALRNPSRMSCIQGEQNSSFYHAIDTSKYDLYTACVHGSIAPALLLPL